MFKRRFRLPSPALVISMVALSLVLGGTAVAASTAKHSDKKADTKLIKQLAPTLSVKHAKTADSATTATSATHATSADSATNATNATNATHANSASSATNASTVGGETVTKIFEKLPATSAPTQIYSMDGLVLTAGCSGGNPVFTAKGPATGEMQVHGAQIGGASFGLEQNGFGVARDLTNGGTIGAGTLSYANTSGQVVTVTYGYDNNPNFGSTNAGCAITGTAIASG